jgi:hypothetical protein
MAQPADRLFAILMRSSSKTSIDGEDGYATICGIHSDMAYMIAMQQQGVGGQGPTAEQMQYMAQGGQGLTAEQLQQMAEQDTKDKP